MSRLKALAVALTVVGASALAAPVAAQDGPSVTLDPATVDAGGEHTITVSGEGYTIADAFVVPCEGVKNIEDLAEQGATGCDLANLTPAPITDGAFSVEVTYVIPDDGMCFAAGDLAQTEVSGACISVGGDDAGADDAADDETEEAADDDEEEAAAETTEADDEDLAGTGADTSRQLTLAGGLLVIAGAALVARRRFAIV